MSVSDLFLLLLFVFYVDVQLSQYSLLKTLSLLHFIGFALCPRSADYIYVGLLLDCIFCSIDPFVFSFANIIILIAVALE